jgi:hypothetical protein
LAAAQDDVKLVFSKFHRQILAQSAQKPYVFAWTVTMMARNLADSRHFVAGGPVTSAATDSFRQ